MRNRKKWPARDSSSYINYTILPLLRDLLASSFTMNDLFAFRIVAAAAVFLSAPWIHNGTQMRQTRQRFKVPHLLHRAKEKRLSNFNSDFSAATTRSLECMRATKDKEGTRKRTLCRLLSNQGQFVRRMFNARTNFHFFVTLKTEQNGK